MTNPEKAQLIHPPIRIMGSTLVRFPFIMSVNMLVSETNTQLFSCRLQQQSSFTKKGIETNTPQYLSWGSWGRPSSWPSWRIRSQRCWNNVSSWQKTKTVKTHCQELFLYKVTDTHTESFTELFPQSSLKRHTPELTSWLTVDYKSSLCSTTSQQSHRATDLFYYNKISKSNCNKCCTTSNIFCVLFYASWLIWIQQNSCKVSRWQWKLVN